MSTYTNILKDFPGFEDITGETFDWIPLASRDHLKTHHIVGICCSIFSYQVAFSIEFAIGTPIMKHLNIPNSVIPLLWALCSLCGFFIQPFIMYRSDSTKSSFGRRRPFILCGGIGIIISLIFLLFNDNIGNFFKGSLKSFVSIVIFIIAFIGLHSSICVCQFPAQSLLKDLVPQHQNTFAKTVGSLMVHLGSIITYLIGGFDIGYYTTNLLTPNQIFILVGIFLILISLVISLFSSKEEKLSEAPIQDNPYREIYSTLRNLPRSIMILSIIYLFSWMAYFPFLVLVTEYFGTHVFRSSNEAGNCFGMLTLSLSSIVELLFTLLQPYIHKIISIKFFYAISMALMSVCLIPAFIITSEKYKYLLLTSFALIGIASASFRTIPLFVLRTTIPAENMYIYHNILLLFSNIGQMISIVVLGCIISFITDNKGMIIGSGSIFAIISAILCKWMVVPNSTDINEELMKTDPIK